MATSLSRNALGTGFMEGMEIAREEKKQQITNKINQLNSLRASQKSMMETLKTQQEIAQKDWTNTLENFKNYSDSLARIKDPVQRQQMIDNMQMMPFFSKSSPQVQQLMTTLARNLETEQKETRQALTNFLSGFTTKNWDEMAQSYAELNAQLTGNPEAQQTLEMASRMMGLKLSPSKGTSVSVYTAEPAMETKTKSNIENKLISLIDQNTELIGALNEFDKELLTIGGHAKAFLNENIDKFRGELSPDQEKFFTDYNSLAQKTGMLVTSIRHQLFGTALSKWELESAKTSFPDIKGGWLHRYFSDSPRQYIDKMKNLYDITQKAIKRLEYTLKNGTVIGYGTEDVQFLDKDGKPLNLNDPRFSVRGKVSEKAQEAAIIAKEIQQANPNLSQDEIIRITKERMGMQ